MVRIGICGIGFMGMIHHLAASKVPGCRVAAICSRDPKKLAGDWSGIQGNFGPKGGPVDLSGVTPYADFGDMLADPEIDLVDLCVPNDEHARLTIRALEAGKPVLVEKPIALTSADASAMIGAAKASGKLLMVGHVLPFFPEFAFALEAIRSGRYGKLRAAHLTRVISRPDWSSGIADADRSGGPAVDLHIHDTHFVGLACGVPKAVHSRGVSERGSMVYLSTQYLYDDPDLAISSTSGALSQSGRPFAHGFEFYLEGATLSFEFANLAGTGHLATPLSVILPDGTVDRPSLAGSGDPVEAFEAELAAAAGAVESGTPCPTLSAELAARALQLCHAEVESARTGKAVALA